MPQLPNNTLLIDPTLEEELSLPSSRRLFIVASQQTASQLFLRVQNTHLIPSLLNLTAGEGQVQSHVVDSATGLTIPSDDSIRFPVPNGGQAQQQQHKWEDNGTGWGVPSFEVLARAMSQGMNLAGQLRETLRGFLDKEEQA